MAVNYGNAPEYPYPWALEECFDVFRGIVESNGESIGMKGWYSFEEGVRTKRNPLKIVLAGDSA